MSATKQAHKTPPPPRCSAPELKQFVDALRQLAQTFRNAETSGDAPWQMRWNLCLGWGVQAGKLLCKCIDKRAFPFLSEGVRKPVWDLRGDELNDKQRYLLATIALGNEKMPLALLTEDDPDPWEIAETPEEDPSTYKALSEAADAMTEEEVKQLHERWRKKVAYQEANPHKHASDRGDHIYLLTWFAAIRWDLAPEHPERLRSDLQQVFHPWIDTFKTPLGKTVTNTPLPVEGIENDHVVHILRAHAEIQADACDLLAEVLESEERILADQAKPCDPATPAEKREEEPTQPVHEVSTAAQFVEQTSESKATTKVEPPAPVSHNRDFTSLTWFGTRYDFARGNQAEAIRVLYEAHDAGGHPLHQKTIGDEIESAAGNKFELRTVFRQRKSGGKGYDMHPAWGTLIQQGASKGTFRLAPPEKQS